MGMFEKKVKDMYPGIQQMLTYDLHHPRHWSRESHIIVTIADPLSKEEQAINHADGLGCMYPEITGILEMQEEFVRNDLQDGMYVAFTMIMDIYERI